MDELYLVGHGPPGHPQRYPADYRQLVLRPILPQPAEPSMLSFSGPNRVSSSAADSPCVLLAEITDIKDGPSRNQHTMLHPFFDLVHLRASEVIEVRQHRDAIVLSKSL